VCRWLDPRAEPEDDTRVRAWLAVLPEVKGDLRLTVDIDPYGFL
jgi:hypothetical protein